MALTLDVPHGTIYDYPQEFSMNTTAIPAEFTKSLRDHYRAAFLEDRGSYKVFSNPWSYDGTSYIFVAPKWVRYGPSITKAAYMSAAMITKVVSKQYPISIKESAANG